MYPEIHLKHLPVILLCKVTLSKWHHSTQQLCLLGASAIISFTYSDKWSLYCIHIAASTAEPGDSELESIPLSALSTKLFAKLQSVKPLQSLGTQWDCTGITEDTNCPEQLPL